MAVTEQRLTEVVTVFQRDVRMRVDAIRLACRVLQSSDVACDLYEIGVLSRLIEKEAKMIVDASDYMAERAREADYIAQHVKV